ncbi:MAG: urea transporter [Crocinitomicaceae bacterium]|nr:urea transporter [Crocinitomicaceae bacterium]
MSNIISIVKKGLLYSYETLVNSYAVVFFSNNALFGILLILASFVDPFSGLAGVIGMLSANIFSWLIGLNKEFIRKGYHGYDAMLVSAGIAHFYTFNFTMVMVIICVGIFSILISSLVHGVLHKYHLPSLSFPFLISIWLIFSAFPTMNTMQVHPHLLYSLNEKQKSVGFSLQNWLDTIALYEQSIIHLPNIVVVYLKSLSSLFFQSNILSGLLIALGLLIYSRIAFSLSIIGYLSAYFFYPLLGGDTADFYEKFIGLNFIFQAIALGGIFLMPSFTSYLITIVLTPLLILVLFGLNKMLFMIGLAPYSLPFTIVTILFLYVLHFRVKINRIQRVIHQTYSPEQNLYNHLNTNHRLRQFNYFPIHLPFWGEWMVSQAHDGKITHLGEWGKAFDFIILDDELKSYQNPGLTTEDFYCFNKPVVACADGYISLVQDNVDDNALNEVNTLQNWGNTIVMYHAEGLYSQISHLKKGSIKYNVGDFVKKGEIIGYCGNSGRSPEPHIHFQLQTVPVIGAKTLDFPLAYYILRDNDSWKLKTFDKPKEGQLVRGVEVNSLLKSAYDLIPGTKLVWSITENNFSKSENWEVFTDSYNNSYIYCSDSKSIAYFYNDGNMILFTHFMGSKKSLLYYFYLANYKVVLGFYPGLTIEEDYPVATIKLKVFNLIQDFIAPFYRFVSANYKLHYTYIDDVNLTSEITLNAEAKIKIGGVQQKAFAFATNLKENKLNQFTVQLGKRNIVAKCEVSK